jgi:predicted transcriptional regulator of viral defense system
MLLSKYVKEGLLCRSHQGVYVLPNKVEDDMLTLMLSSSKIVFSHETALFLNGLSNRTPFIHFLTIPSNASLPKRLARKCPCYYIQPDLYAIGLTTRKNTFGNEVRCYDPERTLCDRVRSRNRLDTKAVASALKNYISGKDKDMAKLSDFA